MDKEKFNSFVAVWCYLIIFSLVFISWNGVVDERINKLEQKISSSYLDRDTFKNILDSLIDKTGTCNIDTYKQEKCDKNTAFRCLFWGEWVWAEIPDGELQEKCRTTNYTRTTTLQKLSDEILEELRCNDVCKNYKEHLSEKIGSGSPYDICMQNCLYNETNITILPNYPTTTIPLPPTTPKPIPTELCCMWVEDSRYFFSVKPFYTKGSVRMWTIEDIKNNITEFLCVDCGDMSKLEGFYANKILDMS